MKRTTLVFTGWIVLLSPSSILAAPTPDATETQTAPAIATKADASADTDIADRIRSIFGEIAALQHVEVRVSAGVVTLSGSVPAADDKKRAEIIATRVAGVVTVQNDIARDLAVGTKVAPAIGVFRDDLRAVVRALPLVGVAVAVAALIAALGYGLASVERLWRWIAPNVFLAELLATSVRIVSIILGLNP